MATTHSKRTRTRTRAFGYVRVSSAGQLDGHGPERQRDAIQSYARANRIEIVEVFEDAHTGTEADRPGFAEMLAALRSNGVRTVLVESMDRLARSLTVQIALTAALRDAAVSLISCTTGQDVIADIERDPMAEAMLLMQGVFAQTEKKLLVKKLRNAREAKRKTGGRCEGRKPFGEAVDLKQRDREQAILKQVRAWRRQDRSWQDMAAKLNEGGHRTRPTKSSPDGREWTRTNLHAVVTKANRTRRR